MPFLDNLQSHKGGLIKLKTQLCWYDSRGWDNNPGRICLILDAARKSAGLAATTDVRRDGVATPADYVAAYFLIDGQPAWIWITEQDVELL